MENTKIHTKKSFFDLFLFNNTNTYISFYLLIISIFLEFYYVNFVHKIYFYDGFSFDFNIVKYVISKFLLIGFLLLSHMLYDKSKFVYSIYSIFMLFVLIPNLILYSYMNVTEGPILVSSFILLLLVFISANKLSVSHIYVQENIKYYFLVLAAILFLIPIAIENGFTVNWKTLFLQEIYETRDVFASKLSSLSSYTFGWEVKVVAPLLLIFCLIKKEYFFAFLAFSFVIYSFLISGHKSVYLSTVVILFFFYLGKNYELKIKYFFALIIFMLIGVYAFDSTFLEGNLTQSIFVRRLFFVPALLNTHYFDFFQNEPIYLSHSILSSFIEYPYDLDPSHLIANEYFAKPEMSSNNGIIADGYMNFGIIGAILYSFIFSIVILFFNSLDIDSRYFGLFFLLIRVFIGSALLTVVLTHGLWILLLLSLVYLRKRKLMNT
ncbi:MAG TPA: hypothetical protein DDX39_01865 [Bacteroidales bacterium]|nr:MAG: hypothetical protein A2W98_08080 [Bacteroidetes bacterium GWF2_33_38]OFY89239.1 MAG: hypothetical protein A2236_13105 [Bacteroidetes bacterium RIFOXYA2_FULL_33_7]HBF87359.1 hypothetical protein [Bacteroidales bacterium]